MIVFDLMGVSNFRLMVLIINGSELLLWFNSYIVCLVQYTSGFYACLREKCRDKVVDWHSYLAGHDDFSFKK